MKLAVYGTLRKGESNHQYYIPTVEPLGIEVVPDYEMYDLGSYPYVISRPQAVEEDVRPSTITVEVYDLLPDVANRIAEMEQGAGYEVAVIPTQFGDALLFYMDTYEHERRQRQNKEHGYKLDQIPDGNWLSRATLAGRSF